LENQKELDDFLRMISPSLKMLVKKHVFKGIITENPIIGNNNKQLLEFIMNKIETVSFPPEQHIISQGNDPDSLYFLKDGECAVVVKDENGN